MKQPKNGRKMEESTFFQPYKRDALDRIRRHSTAGNKGEPHAQTAYIICESARPQTTQTFQLER